MAILLPPKRLVKSPFWCSLMPPARLPPAIPTEVPTLSRASPLAKLTAEGHYDVGGAFDTTQKDGVR